MPKIASKEPLKKPLSKSATVIALMTREQGASLEELTQATGWQPHSARAALSGLKKGQSITRSKVDGVSRYFIAQERAQ